MQSGPVLGFYQVEIAIYIQKRKKTIIYVFMINLYDAYMWIKDIYMIKESPETKDMYTLEKEKQNGCK